MSNELTIVMYHYIRQLEETRYPAIKGLRNSEFRHQIDYLQKEYTIISMRDVVAAQRAGEKLPPKACLLTFDDGYIEHYTTAFPILFDRGLTGCFYPPVATVGRGELLDVNRVHFLLAVADPSELRYAIDRTVRERAETYDLRRPEEYYAEWGVANRFDPPEVIYVKRMLQTVLPEALRNEIARDLFAEHIAMDERAFAHELYMTPDQIRTMVACGMHFGSHGDSHLWLNRADETTQIAEIDSSLAFLRSVGERVDDYWTMAYPYGGWSEGLLGVLRRRECSFALSTILGTADLDRDDPLLLPRYDTNDFPKS